LTPRLGQIDPYDDCEFGQSVMPDLISEIDQLLPDARAGRERRGLLRLRVLAECCAQIANGSLVVIGDWTTTRQPSPLVSDPAPSSPAPPAAGPLRVRLHNDLERALVVEPEGLLHGQMEELERL
jgi:hypothetical protein